MAVRGELVPMVSLRNLFRADGPIPPRQELLLTRHAGQRVGVAVDRLVGRVQAVIQSLGEGLHGLNRFSGATILGDGSVSLILDLSALVSESRFAEHSARTTPFAGGRAETYSMRIPLTNTNHRRPGPLRSDTGFDRRLVCLQRELTNSGRRQMVLIRQAAQAVSESVAHFAGSEVRMSVEDAQKKDVLPEVDEKKSPA